jgi:hypothetical protein
MTSPSCVETRTCVCRPAVLGVWPSPGEWIEQRRGAAESEAKSRRRCEFIDLDRLVKLHVWNLFTWVGFKFLTWYECSYFSRFILGFNGAILSVVGDVLVDSEAPVLTSWISRSADSVLRRRSYGRVCVRALIGVSVRTCCGRPRCTV